LEVQEQQREDKMTADTKVKVTKNCGQCGRPMHLWQDSSGSGWMHDSLADEYRCWPPARDEDEDGTL